MKVFPGNSCCSLAQAIASPPAALVAACSAASAVVARRKAVIPVTIAMLTGVSETVNGRWSLGNCRQKLAFMRRYKHAWAGRLRGSFPL